MVFALNEGLALTGSPAPDNGPAPGDGFDPDISFALDPSSPAFNACLLFPQLHMILFLI
jgi:hypothetical protein